MPPGRVHSSRAADELTLKKGTLGATGALKREREVWRAPPGKASRVNSFFLELIGSYVV